MITPKNSTVEPPPWRRLQDSKALDEMGSAATIFRLCRELEHAQNEKTELQEVVVRIYKALKG